jgi:CubicO group peptidase (beta-lactamase class C family)
METFIGPSSWRRPRGRRRVASALFGAALVTAGLATGAAAAPQTGAPATASPGAGATVGQPPAACAGLRPINQRALQAVVRKTARELHVPGALVRLRTPRGEFAAAYGTTRLGSPIRPQPYTHFRIASITKTMTSAVILQLAQEGKLRLSDPVSKYVPGVPNGDDITIALLLRCAAASSTTPAPPRWRRSSTTTRPRSGPHRSCWRSPSRARPTSRRARTTSTATPTTRCSA